MFKYQKIINFWLIALPNFLLFYASLIVAEHWWYPEGLSAEQASLHLMHFSWIFLIWMVVLLGFRLFEREAFRRYTKLFFTLLTAMTVNLLIAISYFYVQAELTLTPRRFLLVLTLTSFIFILIWDYIIKNLVLKRFIQPVYLFSFNDQLKYLEKEIGKHDYLGYRVIGHVNEEQLKSLSGRAGEIVIFPANLHANPSLVEIIFNLRHKGISFFNHNSFYESLLRRIYLPSLDQIWFLQNIAYDRKIFFHTAKNLLDRLAGLFIFVIFLITFPLVGVAIKLSSKGPVFFRQRRVGIDGKIIEIYKYRTMVDGTHENRWTMPNDQRITSVGKFLRASRLDELPQFINLLVGNMSLVGPRPEQAGIVEQLKKEIPFYEERHVVKPGITGWAQLNVYAGSLDETKLKLEYDLYYIKYQSTILDIEILAKTIYSILSLSGK